LALSTADRHAARARDHHAGRCRSTAARVWHDKPEVARKLYPAIRRVFEHARIRLRDDHGIAMPDNPARWDDLKAMGFEAPTKRSKGSYPSLPYTQLLPIQRPRPRRNSRHRKAARDMKRNEFYTPAWVVELARGCMRGIDLDPASCAVANETVKAATFYDLKKNGLTRPWFGRVWLNPPYGKFSAPFVAMAVKELMAGRIEQAIILLRLNHLSTAWFHATMQAEHLICVPDGRINFASTN
jgi:DNA N-6-adenine-methyltransferase Dam